MSATPTGLPPRKPARAVSVPTFVDHAVDACVPTQCLLDHPLGGTRSGEVGDRPRQASGRLTGPPGDADDRGPLFNQGLGGARPDSRGRSSDDDHMSVEMQFHSRSSSTLKVPRFAVASYAEFTPVS